MQWLNQLQWPAMAVTIVAAGLVASCAERKRSLGFWLFILSNILWIIWGWHDHAYALIALQVGLAVMNVRGASKHDAAHNPDQDSEEARAVARTD